MHLLKGKRANIFIDDLLSTCQGYQLALLQDKFIWNFFGEGGWVFKPSTSSGLPSQRVTYLGLITDSVKMEFEIPSEKLVRTYGRGELFHSKLEGFYFRTLASLGGIVTVS